MPAGAIMRSLKTTPHSWLLASAWPLHSISQPWLFSSCALLKLSCLMIFVASLSNPIHDELSPAFYFAMTSAILTSTALFANVFDSRDAKERPRLQSILNPNQRNLAIMFFHFVVYLVIGTIMFKYLLGLT
ncbi:hypothetical protein BS47DRAFT_655136 [Hydnum rufescens UP504]|uniref:Uncharacterized protein n=1 Tax=Hydnum rufescens UP504 TaxID=1448309 RepID=A0A9P6B588_9AGAM|nr:hypothetical protein BS47DRAFT_655136 [Hydnum rufescens UP504]